MNTNSLNRTVLAVLIGSALAVGLSAPSGARASQRQESRQELEDAREARKRERQSEKDDREAAAAARVQQREAVVVPPRESAQREAGPISEPRPQSDDRFADRQQQQLREQQAAQRVQQADIRRQQAELRDDRREDRVDRPAAVQRDRVTDRAEQREDNVRDRQAQRETQAEQRATQRELQQRPRDARNADIRPKDDPRPVRRLPDRQRDVRITQQRQQAQQYTRVIQQQQPVARAYAETLRRQNRHSHYRYQQQYYRRLLELLARSSWQNYNYYNDPYFYTADDYRYYRGGSYYSINRYGADTLRQAINFGYQEGFWAGRADREDGWRFDYRNAYAYRDANFGYRGFYVSQREYNYYFREGFRRGYEDGYYGRRHYGRSYNGSDVILGNVLSLILNLQAYRY